MRAALDDLAETAAGRRVAVLGDMRELGPDERRFHAELGAHARERRRPARDRRRRWPRGGRLGAASTPSPTRRPAAELVPGLLEPGDTVLVKASRGVGLEAVTEALVRGSRARLMGEVLIGGTAALLLCVFLSPRFIDFMREREFGQHIREEGPEGHHPKAGTPTMGGLIIFIAISVPFLILTTATGARSASSSTALACAAIGFADDYTKIVRRRSLGLRAARSSCCGRDLARAVVGRHREAGISTSVRLRFVDAASTSGSSSRSCCTS